MENRDCRFYQDIDRIAGVIILVAFQYFTIHINDYSDFM